MIEQKALAHVNLYGVLATLENLCELDVPAKSILKRLEKPVSICFDVKGGPCGTLHFTNDSCRFTEGSGGCTCKMNFASPSAFNALIEKSKPGLPTKNPVQVLKFLTGPFTTLTNRLSALLRPSPKAMEDRAFFEESTLLTLYAIAGGISALANTDSISMQSASYTVDGDVKLGIKDSVAVTISVRDHHFTTVKSAPKKPRAIMEFEDIDLAHGLFTGTVSTVNELCSGRIYLSGMISMVDNINRILDRISVYLA